MVQTALRMHSRMPFTGQMVSTGRIGLGELRLRPSTAPPDSSTTSKPTDSTGCSPPNSLRVHRCRGRGSEHWSTRRSRRSTPMRCADARSAPHRTDPISIGPDRFTPGSRSALGSLRCGQQRRRRRATHRHGPVGVRRGSTHHQPAPRRCVRRPRGERVLGASATLPCRCPRCTASDAAAATPRRAPSPVHVHVVVNLSTLAGLDMPGHLDGHERARSRHHPRPAGIGEGQRDQPDRTHQRISAATARLLLDAMCRARGLCCTFPGCTAPAWRGDLDHTNRFDRGRAAAGGATVGANLKPLCRFHHRIKTFTSWRDYQGALGEVVFESPTGHRFRGNAFDGADLFPSLRTPQRRARPPTPADTRRTTRILAEREAREAWTNQAPPF